MCQESRVDEPRVVEVVRDEEEPHPLGEAAPREENRFSGVLAALDGLRDIVFRSAEGEDDPDIRVALAIRALGENAANNQLTDDQLIATVFLLRTLVLG